MLQVRLRNERGHTRLDWLDSYHTFSFGDYEDAIFTGYGDLQVINDDTVSPGGGFETHAHENMDIITYVLDGTLAHKDSLGNGSLIHPGEVQRMTAGTGIQHSEFNPSELDSVHFLQIWICPATEGLAPGYEQSAFNLAEKPGHWRLIASPDGREGSLTVHQDMLLLAAKLSYGGELAYGLRPDRACWVQVATGVVQLNGKLLEPGDGVAVQDEDMLELEGISNDAEVLLFDLRPPA